MSKLVFVYGTLMKGEANHQRFDDDTEYIGKAHINDYALYHLECFPAILPSKGEKVKGEVYQVDDSTEKKLDILEGEGHLYARRNGIAHLDNGEMVPVFFYEYLHGVELEKKVAFENQPWSMAKMELNLQPCKNYVWYVTYGSNMLYERFRCYIEGGSFCGGSPYKGCRDKSLPVRSKTVIIPYGMYYANRSSRWDNAGVSFLDDTQPRSKYKSLGVAYLITEEQFKDVQEQEGPSWYGKEVKLGYIDGWPAKTFTNEARLDDNPPCSRYMAVLMEGITNNYPYMTEQQVAEYVKNPKEFFQALPKQDIKLVCSECKFFCKNSETFCTLNMCWPSAIRACEHYLTSEYRWIMYDSYPE